MLFDNPKTVATGHLAGVAVLNPDLVRLAAHYRFSPRTTERQDPESKGKVEAVVRFTKSDLIPYEGFESLDDANQAGAAWCEEVNGEIHCETLIEQQEARLGRCSGMTPGLNARDPHRRRGIGRKRKG